MECKEIEKRISAFLQGDMERREMETFIAHMEECESCYEELSIQYLVERGMERLEDGNAFDLNRELGSLMHGARKRVHRFEMIKMFFVFFGIIGLLSVILFWLVKVMV